MSSFYSGGGGAGHRGSSSRGGGSHYPAHAIVPGEVAAPQQHHYGPKNSLRRSDARQREATLAAEAEERHEMLCQLQDYVKYTLQPKLETVVIERDELAQEVDRLEIENDQIKEQVSFLQLRLADAEKAKENSSTVIGDKLDRIVKETQEHLDAEKRASKLALEKRDAEILELQSKLKKASSTENIDVEGRKRNSELERALSARDDDIRELNDALKQVKQKLIETEQRAVEVAPIVSAISKTTMELKMFVEDCTEHAGSLSTAATKAGVDGTTAVTAWKSLSATVAKIKDGVPVKTLLEDVHILCVGIRTAARQEGVFVAQCIKSFILKQQEMSSLIVKKDHEKQMERDLSKRRLDEVEKDRHEERETLLKQIEKEKMKVLLGGVASPTAGAAGSPSRFHQPSGSPSGAGRRVGGDSASSPTGGLVSPFSGASINHVGVQTGTELLEVGTAGESLLVMRLRQEVDTLTQQLTESRQTMAVMEEQRRHFMGFVGDRGQSDLVVKAALNGPSLDFAFGGPLHI